LELLKQYRLYTTEAEVDGRLWHRLRLGFFPDKEYAIEVFEQLKKDFPHAWVTKAPRSDHAAAEVMTPAKNAPPPEQKPAETPPTPGPAVAPAPIPVPVPAPPSAPSAVTTPKPTVETSQEAQREQSLLDEGESVMVAQNYSRAVQIYTRLTQSEDPAIRQQAQEYLGLARERNGQLAHAKAEYEKYLQLYPKGEGVERVKQRLAGLLTARATPKGKLRKAKRPLAKNEWRNEVYGSFSQFYDRDVTYTDSSDTIINRTALSSDLDINTRSRNDHYDIRTTFIGGLENSFLDDGEDEVTINSLYVDALIRKLELSTRIGRQSRSSGGVLGRFDGGLLRWQFNDSVAVNLVGGFPVASTKDTDIDTDRPLYGISFDLGTFAKRWNFTTYFITQDVQGILDRRAIGGEVRYFDPTLSFFGLVDYDVSYSKLNTALLTANWTLPTKTSLNMSIDYRTSPILTTSSALIGQTTLTSIDAMRSTLTEDEIRQLARDRTATTRTFTLGFTQPLNQKLQISGDVTMSDYSGTPASPEVPSATPGDPPLIVALEAQPKTGFDYYYSLQLIGSSLIKDGDIAILGLRYSDTQTSNTYSVSVNTRYPVTREFRVNPRAILDYRTNKDGNSEQWKFRPLLRLEYTWKRRYHLELEGGGEWSSEKLAGNGQSDDRRGYFLTVGYRISF